MRIWVVDDPDDAETTVSGPRGGEPGYFVAEDARLIAAAPELLAALSTLESDYIEFSPDGEIYPCGWCSKDTAVAHAADCPFAPIAAAWLEPGETPETKGD